MNSFSPRELFQKCHPEFMAMVAANAPLPYMSVALSATLAHIAWEGATESELKGIQRFIGAFVNMGEKVKPLKTELPVKKLDELTPEQIMERITKGEPEKK